MNQISCDTNLYINNKKYKNPLNMTVNQNYINNKKIEYNNIQQNTNNTLPPFDEQTVINEYKSKCQFYEGDVNNFNFRHLHKKFLKLVLNIICLLPFLFNT